MSAPPETVYRGVRAVASDNFLRVHVTVGELPLRLPVSFRDGGFEWGYKGHGPKQLALALVLDATGDRVTAQRAALWFMSAVVCNWGERWLITAAEVVGWVERWQREQQRQAERVLDPGHVATVAVAPAHPDEFFGGMDVSEVHVRVDLPEGGAP